MKEPKSIEEIKGIRAQQRPKYERKESDGDKETPKEADSEESPSTPEKEEE